MNASTSTDGHGAGEPTPPRHEFEIERLAAVREFEPLLPPDDRAMRIVACQAAQACEAPIGMVSLLEEREERVLACFGGEIERLDRSASICAYAILGTELFTIDDLTADPRFRNNPAVVGAPFIRFYAGQPILDATGLPLGTVCVLDLVPQAISAKGALALRHLAEIASAVLEARLLLADAHVRYVPKQGASESQARMNRLLAILVEPRSDQR